jgi:Fe2+ or Zn2+ uptake regulation protein
MAAKERAARLDDDLRVRVERRLAHVDQRFTRKREALVAVLAAAGRPLTIPEISQHDAELAASSIYRNLTVLEQVGVVRRLLTAGDFAHYELAEDLTERHHHHLVCSSCGAVEDFEAPSKLEQAVRSTQRQIQDCVGFQTESHLVDLIGLCADCA